MKGIAVLFASILMIVGSAGCGSNSSTGALKDFKFGYQLSVYDAPAFIGIQKGWFKDALASAGYHLITGTAPVGGPILQGLAGGQYDVGDVGTGLVVSGVSKGIGIKAVMVINVSGESVMVAPNSSVRTIADLKGKKISIPAKGSMQDIVIHKALLDAGVPIANVTLIELPAADAITALAKGQIDAAVLYEPFTANLQISQKARVLKMGQELWPNHDNENLAATQAAISKDPKAVQIMVDQMDRALKYLQSNPEDSKKIVADTLNLSSQVVDQSFTNITRPTIGCPNAQGIIEFSDYLIKFGYSTTKLTSTQVVDPHFLNCPTG